MLLLVGLGNPGPEHANQRHNIGFMAVDEIVRRHGFSPWRSKFQGLAAEGTVNGVKVLALKPETYMNRSGQSVGAAAQFYKIEPADIVVIHDELDLRPGKLRVKSGGGSAGHNGLRSIDAHLGPDFVRVRVGIGHPGEKHLVHGYVLHDFGKEERSRMAALIDAMAEAFPLLAKGDGVGFMNKVSLLVPASQNGADETAAGKANGKA
jgi:PTH1 family peptidyl-tRNA hydrolase